MKESLESATENLLGEVRRGKSIKLGRGLQWLFTSKRRQ